MWDYAAVGTESCWGLYSCGDKTVGLYSYGDRTVGLYSCAAIQLLRQELWGLYSCGDIDLWGDYTAVKT